MWNNYGGLFLIMSKLSCILHILPFLYYFIASVLSLVPGQTFPNCGAWVVCMRDIF